MRPPKSPTPFLAVMLILATPGVSRAWSYAGHRVIASIAYRQLDEPTRKRVAEVLKKHPAYADLWANRATNGADEALALFWNASVFPDDARRPPWAKYNRPSAHYVNYRILADQGNRVEPPARTARTSSTPTSPTSEADRGAEDLRRGQGAAPQLDLPPGGRHPPAAPRRRPVLQGAARTAIGAATA